MLAASKLLARASNFFIYFGAVSQNPLFLQSSFFVYFGAFSQNPLFLQRFFFNSFWSSFRKSPFGLLQHCRYSFLRHSCNILVRHGFLIPVQHLFLDSLMHISFKYLTGNIRNILVILNIWFHSLNPLF